MALSPAMQWALANGMSAEDVYKNIQDFLATNPTAAQSEAQMAQFGISAEDVAAATRGQKAAVNTTKNQVYEDTAAAEDIGLASLPAAKAATAQTNTTATQPAGVASLPAANTPPTIASLTDAYNRLGATYTTSDITEAGEQVHVQLFLIHQQFVFFEK
jgi:hypothetical protein